MKPWHGQEWAKVMVRNRGVERVPLLLLLVMLVMRRGGRSY
jgi:hypothetical protein